MRWLHLEASAQANFEHVSQSAVTSACDVKCAVACFDQKMIGDIPTEPHTATEGAAVCFFGLSENETAGDHFEPNDAGACRDERSKARLEDVVFHAQQRAVEKTVVPADIRTAN